MRPIPYIFFDGNCTEAMTFWAGVFGTEDSLALTKVGEMPDDIRATMPGVSPEAVLNGTVNVGDGCIFGSDDVSTEDVPLTASQGVSIMVSFPAAEESRRVFEALAEGGKVNRPMQGTFFSPAFGIVTDRFGVRWLIQTDQPGD